MEFIKMIFLAIATGIIGLAIIMVSSLVFAVPIYILWNWIVPTIFGAEAISLFQAWGLYVLTGLLFRSSLSPAGNNKAE